MKQIYFLFLIIIFSLGFNLKLLAHEGHDHGPTPGEISSVTGPITLTDQTIKNLGIESVEVNLAPLQRSLTMPAQIELLPEKLSQISPRFEGRVLEILVKLGEEVQPSQPLLKLDPVTIGNPPVTLRSSIGGFVTKQNLTVGQSFTPQTVLMEVADYRKVFVRGITYENTDLSQIKIGQDAQVKVDLFPEKIFTGKVERMNVGFNPNTKAFEIFVTLDNPDLMFKPNMQASLSIGLGEVEEVLAVPKRAVVGDTGNYFVFVQTGNEFEKRPIVLGIKAGDQIEILEGVFPGERVVIQGNYQLQYATGVKKEGEHEEGHHHEHASKRSGASLLFWMIAGGVFAFTLFAGIFYMRRYK